MGHVRAGDQGPVDEADPALGDQLGDQQLDSRELGGQPPQAAVVLRLVRQLREVARQEPPDRTEELAIRTQPGRRLGHRQRDQLLVCDLARRTWAIGVGHGGPPMTVDGTSSFLGACWVEVGGTSILDDTVEHPLPSARTTRLRAHG